MSESSPPDSTSPKGDRVLVVEDEPLVALYLKDALGELGYDRGIPGTGEEALSAAEAQRPVPALVEERAAALRGALRAPPPT